MLSYSCKDDALFGSLTVQETFEVAAALRLPSSMGRKTKAALVDGLIMELGLSKAKDTYIGNMFIRGVSGGERKRTNVGVELLSGPSLVFLDECVFVCPLLWSCWHCVPAPCADNDFLFLQADVGAR